MSWGIRNLHARGGGYGQVASTLNPHISRYCSVTLETCAYAGTGDVLKVQDMLFMCGEHINIENQGEGPDFYWMVRGLLHMQSSPSVLPCCKRC